MIYTLNQILFMRSSQGGRDGLNMWHAEGEEDSCSVLVWKLNEEASLEDLATARRIILHWSFKKLEWG